MFKSLNLKPKDQQQVKKNSGNNGLINDIIDAIVTYELDVNNGPIVNKRKKLWFYIKEIKADKYLSKYIIFN